MPAELVFSSNTTYKDVEVTDYGEYVSKLKEKTQLAHEIARRYLGVKARRRKDCHDAKLSLKSYKAGDVVWHLNNFRKVGVSQKLTKLYDGPFLIKRKISDVNFLMQMNQDNQNKVVHHDKLKAFEGRDLPKWIKKARGKLKA